MKLLRALPVVLFSAMILGLCAAALTACGGDDTVVIDDAPDAAVHDAAHD